MQEVLVQISETKRLTEQIIFSYSKIDSSKTFLQTLLTQNEFHIQNIW